MNDVRPYPDWLVFALAGSFALALGDFWFASLTRKLFYPLYAGCINVGLDPIVRATVNSVSNQANSLVSAPPWPSPGPRYRSPSCST